jgi:hypothetical protein
MQIGFLSLPVPGHLYPMTALARKLQSRGHDVVFISLVDTAPFVEAAELPFVPCSEAVYPAGSFGAFVRRLSELSGEDALHFTVNTMMKGYTASLFESLPNSRHVCNRNHYNRHQKRHGIGLRPVCPQVSWQSGAAMHRWARARASDQAGDRPGSRASFRSCRAQSATHGREWDALLPMR